MRILLILLCVGTIGGAMLGCSSTTTAPPAPIAESNSFIGNGDGYTNAIFTAVAKDSTNFAFVDDVSGEGAFSFKGKETVSGNEFSVTGRVKKTDQGTYLISAADGVNIVIQITKSTGEVVYLAASGSIVIDSWGANGGRAKGTFTVNMFSTTGVAFAVTNGKFDCVVVDT